MIRHSKETETDFHLLRAGRRLLVSNNPFIEKPSNGLTVLVSTQSLRWKGWFLLVEIE
jgi:hypothetical protein